MPSVHSMITSESPWLLYLSGFVLVVRMLALGLWSSTANPEFLGPTGLWFLSRLQKAPPDAVSLRLRGSKARMVGKQRGYCK